MSKFQVGDTVKRKDGTKFLEGCLTREITKIEMCEFSRVNKNYTGRFFCWDENIELVSRKTTEPLECAIQVLVTKMYEHQAELSREIEVLQEKLQNVRNAIETVEGLL